MQHYRQIFERTASLAGLLCAGYEELRIRDHIPDPNAWAAFCREFCAALEPVCSTVTASELDYFWSTNRTFRELLEYVRVTCDPPR
ncbi:MAG TPA: hypothetical protein VMW43_12535 [Bacteroidota bacterium]|nr:hypothetical protein [Bacteroidota bacterium]